MSDINKTLEKLGLNEKEIKIYIASLSIGQSPASILGAKAKINRTTAQYTCNSLYEKKLLSKITRGNTILYTPEDPEKLLKIINSEYTALEKKMIETKNVISELKSIINPRNKLPKITYYEGVEGIINMFDDIFKENSTIYGCLEITDDIDPEIEKYLGTIYTQKRAKSGIKAYMLFNTGTKTLKYRENDKKLNRISLLVDNKEYPFDSCIHIYGEKIAMYSYKRGDLVGVIIKNSFIQKNIFSIFKLAWNTARNMDINNEYKNIEI